MSVPTIALCATPPSGVHHCAASSVADYDLNPRIVSSSLAATSSSSQTPASQRPIVGGLSRLFSSASASSSAIGVVVSDDHHFRSDDLGSSFGYYSPFKCSRDHQMSPVSVFQGPVTVGSSRSPSLPRIQRDICSSSSPPSFSSYYRVGREKLFNRFVRNALGSCLDYDSPSFPMPPGQTGGGLDVDEFTFNMEDGFIVPPPYAKELLLSAQSRHKIFLEDFVVKAFYEAEKAHRGQMRASGDPYLQHCVETAVLLATIGANSTVVAAGLLHDTIDDSYMDYDYMFRTFGADVVILLKELVFHCVAICFSTWERCLDLDTSIQEIVREAQWFAPEMTWRYLVSKLSHLSKLARDNNTACKTAEADRLHTMFLAMVDARAVLIKLADRLHNMMTLEALPMIKQQRFAKETLEIFAPLANRLGISSWKEQLENTCFKYLNPEQHKELSSKLVKSFDEALIASAIGKLEQALKDQGVSYHVLSGRHKSLYSIYAKMLKKKLSMSEIHDIHGLRLIVEKEDDCYAALDIVHRLWPKAIGRLKDYIIHPKFNGYQSLHTVVLGEDKVPLEVQIRTKEMHQQAEFGFASHWRYKEGDCKHSSFVLQMVEWARWVVTWQCEAMGKDIDSIRPPCPFPKHSDDCPYSYTSNVDHQGPVFIMIMENEKMSVQEFPPNSTVMDLLERVGRGSSRWPPYRIPIKEELRPKLNHEPVSNPHRKLKMGDVVELTPAIPHKYLSEYREEIQRMYDGGHTVLISGDWRS
ncbi:hypothetical protein QJS10_CPA09g00108 [Acorus calamus]|uniref:GTP diphosphokinase n=1 Tax=Acorus calamus TaxID=4465 RepID=A0AAV9E313_ACOCL|nr:hypothetical protein QJS10_CPA09g00108 [Acorus calamus]